MKKIFIALLISTGLMNAQEKTETKSADARSKLHLGIKGGINNSNVYDEASEEFQAAPKYGFAGGLFLSVPLGRLLGVQPRY